jgi:hypothetical protein
VKRTVCVHAVREFIATRTVSEDNRSFTRYALFDLAIFVSPPWGNAVKQFSAVFSGVYEFGYYPAAQLAAARLYIVMLHAQKIVHSVAQRGDTWTGNTAFLSNPQ